METQKITLAIPEHILRKIEIIAAKQGTSVSGLMTRVLEDIVVREEGFEAARHRHLQLLDSGIELGTNGMATWRREDVHGATQFIKI